MRNAVLAIVIVCASMFAAAPSRAVATAAAAQAGQARACLHGDNETAEQRTRRVQALSLARDVNTAQAAVKGANGLYQYQLNLPLTQPTPAGFRLQVTTDGASYAFSVKDTTDPCLFAYFSDESGIILVGRVIQ